MKCFPLLVLIILASCGKNDGVVTIKKPALSNLQAQIETSSTSTTSSDNLANLKFKNYRLKGIRCTNIHTGEMQTATTYYTNQTINLNNNNFTTTIENDHCTLNVQGTITGTIGLFSFSSISIISMSPGPSCTIDFRNSLYTGAPITINSGDTIADILNKNPNDLGRIFFTPPVQENCFPLYTEF